MPARNAQAHMARQSALTQTVRVGKTRTGTFGSRVAGVAGRESTGGRTGMTDAAVRSGSSAYGRSAPGTSLGGFGGAIASGGGLEEHTTGAGGVPVQPPKPVPVPTSPPPREGSGGTIPDLPPDFGPGKGGGSAGGSSTPTFTRIAKPATGKAKPKPKAAPKPKPKPKPGVPGKSAGRPTSGPQSASRPKPIARTGVAGKSAGRPTRKAGTKGPSQAPRQGSMLSKKAI